MRKYVFVCDGCGEESPQDSECLPTGWAVLANALGQFDICSVNCLFKKVALPPRRVVEEP